MIRTHAELARRRSSRRSFLDAALVALGLALTAAAGVAGVYASGFHLSQPDAPAHIVPLWVILGTVATVGVWYLQSNALRGGQVVPLAALVGAAVLAGGLVLALGPDADVSTPVGAKLPWLMVSLAAAALGNLLLVLLVVRRRRHDTSPPGVLVPVGTPLGLLAAVLASGLVVGLGVGAAHLVATSLDTVNEYHENPIAGPGSVATSTLTGDVAWQVRSAFRPRLLTSTVPDGVLTTEGGALVELDAATGGVRWRYRRSDVEADTSPEVRSLDQGRELAVRWPASRLFVLDSRTGTRLDRWSAEDTDSLRNQIDDGDPTLQEHPVRPTESSMLTVVDDRGHRQWQYQQPCHQITGVRTSPVILVQARDQCGRSDQTLGLDPRTGRQRWALDHTLSVLALSDTVAVSSVAVDAVDHAPTAMSGIDLASGRTRWTTPLRAGGQSCPATRFQTQADSLMVICVRGRSAGVSHTYALRYDIATGRLLDQADLGSQEVESATVTADGRMVVLATGRHAPSCPVTVVQADGTQTVLNGIEPDSACLDTVQARGNQVLVTQLVTDSLHALR